MIERSAEVEPGHITSTLEYVAGARAPVLVLAHGAGAGQRNAFMVQAARALADRGITVVTFDFLYMAEGRKAPDRAPRLEQTWRAVIAGVVERLGGPIAIGGKSMGGRIATHIALPASRSSGWATTTARYLFRRGARPVA